MSSLLSVKNSNYLLFSRWETNMQKGKEDEGDGKKWVLKC